MIELIIAIIACVCGFVSVIIGAVVLAKIVRKEKGAEK